MKIIPTLHPSFIMRGKWELLSMLRNDAAKALRESYSPVVTRHDVTYLTHPTPDQAAALLRPNDPRPLIIDIETIMTTGEITHCGVGRQAMEAACLPWREPYTSMMREALMDASSLKVAHNAPFDFPRLAAALGCGLPAGPWFDTLEAHALVEPDHPHRLESVAVEYYDRTPWKADKESLELYNCRDVDATFRCYEGLEREMHRWGVTRVFESLTMPNVRTVIDMTDLGIRLDEGRLVAVRQKFELEKIAAERVLQEHYLANPDRQALVRATSKEIELLHLQASQLDKPGTKREAGKLRTKARKLEEMILKPINLGSPKQLLDYIQSLDRKLATVDSTDEDAIIRAIRLAPAQEPFLRTLLRWRECHKVISTYLSYDSLHLHPRFLLWGTASGRLSCRDPNIQNIPKRREWSWEIRSCFVPPIPGWEFTEVDYSQIERRIQAVIWQDEALLAAYAAGIDTHTNTAALMFGVPMDAVTKEQRYFAKRVVYGDSYGMGWEKLRNELMKEGVLLSATEAKDLLRRLRVAHPGVAEGQRRVLAEASQRHYLRNAFGRIRHFLDPSTHGEALNFLPQSTAACIILRAMSQLDALPHGARLVAQIHDSLLLCHPPGTGPGVAEAVRQIMEAPVPELGNTVFPTDATVGGKNWAFR